MATTISTLNSFVEGVGGEYVTVKNIVPVGASPETFQPAPQDVATVADAAVLVENGAGLEAWLDRLLRDAGSKNLRVVVCADGSPVKNLNPHLWMDPVLAQRYVSKIRDALVAADPAHAGAYRRNAASYDARLAELTKSIQRQIDTIPPSHRYMIVFHNAWQYYNDRFGI
ncbi:MAG: zinc ABC transporter substrate-binding protein, partial [Candidatus Eremiobacteraeota bacterium]|nr:zinc ABC transporter substrate-binding protein [Candidatus Eremiobacteraeota bacterium]